MRLRKNIISIVLATCMAVTIMPSGMPLKAMASEVAKTTEGAKEEIEIPEEQSLIMPEILQGETAEKVPESNGYGIETLAGEEDISGNYISRSYISTKEQSISFDLELMEKPQYAVENKENTIVYLFDKDNKIAAKSVEPENWWESGTKWRIHFYSIYRNRELKTGEKLYVGYSIDNGEVHKLTDVILTVTDQPYIYDIDFNYIKDRACDNYGNGFGGLYSGEDDTSIAIISGYNIDFSKLSLNLKDKITGDITAASVKYIEQYKGRAYYYIKWNNPIAPYNSYTIEYNYNGANLVLENNVSNYSYLYDPYNDNDNIIWNHKESTVEYYNREMPAGVTISYEIKEYYSQKEVCVTGSGITVSDSHLIKINLKDKLPDDYERQYYLSIKYKDGGQEKNWNKYFYAYKSIEERGYWRILNSFYTNNNNKIEIFAEIYSDDVLSNENKLSDTCKVNIFANHTSNSVGEIELKLKKEGNKILYYGTYNNKLDLGEYDFSFSPDGEHKLRYCFFVYDSSKLYLSGQSYNIIQGTIIAGFPTSKAAEWYCKNPENLNKFIIKILDIEGNEIGTYKYSNGDFTISNIDMGYAAVSINFTDKIKEVLDNIYYCNIYFYYGDEASDNTIAKYAYTTYDSETGTTEYRNFYNELNHESEFIRWDSDDITWVQMAASMNGNIYYGGDSFYDRTCNTVTGADSAFPAKLTITDWYSLKPVKEITINKPNHIFTESELDGLSSTKAYNFFLKGADGSASMASGYIGTGDAENDDENKPSATPAPSPTPTIKPSVGGGSGGGGGGYVPPVNNGGTTPVQPTIQPEATASPATTAEATMQPTVAPTTQPTTAPEPSVAPAATVPPADIKETDNVVVNPYTPAPEKKTNLTLKKKKITLNKGQKAQIKITSKLSTSVTYKSLKPSVATVSKKGVVTAKKAGKATITVKANGQVKKVTVTVKDTKKTAEKAVKASSSVKLNKDFKLAKTSVTLNKGKKLTIQKASGLSGKVTFRSLDKKIASVSVNGVVKAKKKGKTTILIKKGKKTIKLKITVKK